MTPDAPFSSMSIGDTVFVPRDYRTPDIFRKHLEYQAMAFRCRAGVDAPTFDMRRHIVDGRDGVEITCKAPIPKLTPGQLRDIALAGIGPHASLTSYLLGDPLPGRSALEQRGRA